MKSRVTSTFGNPGDAELAAEGLQHTAVCAKFRDGFCSFGDACLFAHPASDVWVSDGKNSSQRSKKQFAKEMHRMRKLEQDSVENIEEQRRTAAFRAFESELSAAAELPQAPGAPPHAAGADAPPLASSAGAAAADFPEEDPAAEEIVEGRQVYFGGAELLEEEGPTADVEVGQKDGQRMLHDIFLKQPWTVLLADSAFAFLQCASSAQQKAALRVLKVLASGRWPEEQREQVDSHGPLKLRRARFDKFSILWSIDVDFDEGRGAFVEVLQIWDVTDEKRFDEVRSATLKEWRQSKRSFEGVSNALRRQKLHKEATVRLPRVVQRGDLQDSDVFSVRKFFTLDGQMLHCMLFEEAGRRGVVSASEQFPLRISKQEASVVEKKGPLIVIGRSGSGKTLCCVYRMFFQHQAYWKEAGANGGAPLLPDDRLGFVHYNQVFVTHSASLANKVLEYFSNLQDGAQRREAGAGAVLGGGSAEIAARRLGAAARGGGGLAQHPLEQSRLPDDIRNVQVFPIFVTFRKLLVMVDGCQPTPFFPRRPGGGVHLDKVDLADAPDALDPLAALRAQRRQVQRARALGASRPGQSAPGRPTVLMEVDYELFQLRFWPKLRQHCPQGCDACLVWREIQSYIKGHLRVLESPRGFLDLSEYCEVTKKCSPGFEEFRGQIYEAFKAYEDLRKKWSCFDRMDACLHVLRQLQHTPYMGPPIQCVAVDEVQDLAQLELALFFKVVRRPYEELFITGDTSQTVSRAVDFRFCDLRSLFHHFKEPPPVIDQLITNYRSHQKILALSHRGVVRVLELAFPHAVDVLQPDLGHRDGPRPIVVTDVRLEDLGKFIFNLDGSAGGIAFGASQCILVRNEEAKNALPQELRGALVLTVEQSKGLEFDDVILVNFFHNSSYSEWQVMKVFREELLDSCDKQEAPSQERSRKRPHFERHRHALFCSELKHLYTAITRTKHVLLFIEDDSRQAQHAFDLWGAMRLVSFGLMTEENKEAVSQLISRKGEEKGEESWRVTGVNLLHKGLFEQARSCFARAGDEAMQRVCDAYVLTRRAAEACAESDAEGQQLYLEAAALFAQAGNAERERAECLLQGGRALEAAELFGTLGPELRADAARAFDLAGQHRRASELHEELEHYHEAVSSLMRIEATADVKRVVLLAHEREKLNADECFRYLQGMDSHDVAGELYLREKDYIRAATCFQSAGLLGKQAECYKQLKQPRKAAELLSQSSDPIELRHAADLYYNLSDSRAAADCYRNLLRMDERIDDRRNITRLCVQLLEGLKDWIPAAELREDLNGDEDLDAAIEHYLKADLRGEAARVCEKKARTGDPSSTWNNLGGLAWELRTTLCRAAKLYRHAGRREDAKRIYAELEEWEVCGEIASSLKSYGEAAKHFLRAGNRKKQVDCLVLAKEFAEALDVLVQLPERDHELEIECLIGKEEYTKAARKRMQTLPPRDDDDSKDLRDKQVLKAFDLAKRDRNQWKSFLADFSHEMPDPITALIYFAEIVAAPDLADHLEREGKRLDAAGVASICGDPKLSVSKLRDLAEDTNVDASEQKQDLEDTNVDASEQKQDLEGAMLDVLHVAALSDLDKALASDLLPACDWLRERRGVSVTRLELVEVMLHRMAATGGNCQRERGERSQKLRETLKQDAILGSDPLMQLFREELALVGHFGDVKSALDGVHDARTRLREDWQLYYDMLEKCYCVWSELHRSCLCTLHSYFTASKGQKKDGSMWVLDDRNAVVVPKGHILARVSESAPEPVASFPAVTHLRKPDAFMVEDLCNREDTLLARLSSMKEDARVFEAPCLWLRAHHAALEGTERRARLRRGFIDSLVKACAVAVTHRGELPKEVSDQIPDCAEEIWSQAHGDLWEKLRSACGDRDFAQVSLTLSRAMSNITCMFQVYWKPKATDEQVVESVTRVVLKGLRELKPVCYTHVYQFCRRDDCPYDHPKVWKTTDPSFPLNCAEGHAEARYPAGLLGIGLQGWIDVAAVCCDYVNGRCKRSACRCVHPGEQAMEALRQEFGSGTMYKDMASAEKASKALARSSGAREAHRRPLPDGFGYAFFHDADMTENTRLVALLAWTLTGRDSVFKFSYGACKQLLQRMCLATYRYPEERAAKFTKHVLDSLRFEDLQKLSKTVTWEVDSQGSNWNSKRCLLSRVVGKSVPKPKAEPKAKIQPTGILPRPARSQFAFNQNAREFVPTSLQQPRANQWDAHGEGGAASHLFRSDWTPTLPRTPPQQTPPQQTPPQQESYYTSNTASGSGQSG